MSALVWSLKNGDLDQVKKIISVEHLNPNIEIEGRPLIHYAADYGQKEIIEFLIEIGANINIVDKHGISPLLAAIWENHSECVKLMISKGADKNGKTPDGINYIDVTENEEIKNLLK